jgi:acyl-CoA synthetase (AMP-forming)/AMP-acid ligase II
MTLKIRVPLPNEPRKRGAPLGLSRFQRSLHYAYAGDVPGCEVRFAQNFDPRMFVETVERESVTHVMMVPSRVVALLASPHFSAKALRSLEMICTVGAPLHLEHKEKLNRCLSGRFYELYGLTEGFVTVLDKSQSLLSQILSAHPSRFLKCVSSMS